MLSIFFVHLFLKLSKIDISEICEISRLSADRSRTEE